MMPLIQPLPSRSEPRTEYEKERARVAEMQAELRQRKSFVRDLLRRVRRVLDSVRRLWLRRVPGGKTQGTQGRLRSAQSNGRAAD